MESIDNIVSLVDFSRQAELDNEMCYTSADQNKTYTSRNLHVIVGCGGVGFWLGTLLSMMGECHFLMFEGEKIDESNLNRLPVAQSMLGLNKAIVLRRQIRWSRPNTICTCITKHFTEGNKKIITNHIGKGSIERRFDRTFIWDCTDNARTQKMITKVSKELRRVHSNLTYRKIGYEGWNIGNYPNMDVWLNEETYETGYRTTRASAITSAMAAAFGIFAVGLGMNFDVNINLKQVLQNSKKKKGMTNDIQSQQAIREDRVAEETRRRERDARNPFTEGTVSDELARTLSQSLQQASPTQRRGQGVWRTNQ